MTKQGTWQFFYWAAAILIIGIGLAGFYQAGPNKGFSNSGAVLTFIPLASVGIERLLEGFWTFIGLTKDTFWPFNALSQQISSMSTELNQVLNPFYQQLTQEVENAQTKLSPQEYAAAKKRISDLQTSIDQITKLAPGSQQATAVASAASQLISSLQKTYPTLDTLATFANEAISGFANFIVTPIDNLGRRFISLFAGTFLGVGLTGVLRLDLVQAIFQSPTVGNLLGFNFYCGIVFTGIVMGLGSNPTHEVIRVLQALKTNLKIQNATAQL